MKNAAALAQKSAWILSPTQIRDLEALPENSRREALLRLGTAQIRRAQEDWRRLGREAFDLQKQLLEDRDHVYALAESREERREYEKKIEDSAGDITQADSIVEILGHYLATVESSEVGTALVARAAELRKNSEARVAFSQLPAAIRAVAALAAKIDQGNEEAMAINPHLQERCDSIPIFDIRITHLPGHTSLMRLLATHLSSLSISFPEPITVSRPGPAAYPEPVKAALAKLEERRRAQIAAAQMRPHHVGSSPQPTFVTTTPAPQPETFQDEAAPRSLARNVRGSNGSND
jgi:hypothetical protein